MSEKKIATVPVPPVETDESLKKVKGFWDRFSKPIIYAGSAIIIAIAGYYGYKTFVKEPKELKAAETIFPAENLFGKMANTGFNKDSVNILLNGGALDGNPVTGLLKVQSNFGGTEAANRAAYMTGAAYLHIKEFDKAIKYLKQFDGNGASQVESRANLMLGHAYAEKKNTDEALSYYRKAATVNPKDETFAADALLTAAAYAESLGKSKEAIELYQQVQEKYPTNTAAQNGEIDKHLAKLGVIK
ncbi:MAG: tetratricopeptide repeat protein [Ferruginibacter sp.]